MTIKCVSCDEEIDYALVDAYGVGDRLLEGVMFEVRFDGAKYKAVPTPEAEKYMRQSGISIKKWSKAVAEYVTELPDVQLCPLCNDEAVVGNYDNTVTLTFKK